MSLESKYLLATIKYLLNDKKSELPIPNAQMDWEKLLKLAKQHSVLNLLHYGNDNLPEDKKQMLYTNAMKAIVVSVNQMEAAKEVMEACEKEKIDILAVKGICTKQHYPQPDIRTMGDIDLLFRPEQQKMLEKVMTGLKYDQSEEGRKHDSYFRKPYINVEMHRELVASDSEYNTYYENIWEKVQLKETCKHIYEMCLEDEYIYVLLHLVEHFKNGGIGIRFIMDVYIYNKMDNMDWGYVKSELQKLGVYEFYQNISKLAECWFGKGETKGAKIEQMEQFIIANGVYGSKTNAAAISVVKGGRLHFLFKTLFPNYKNMCSMFPWLKKWPILLPYSWLLRGVRSVLFRRNNIKVQLNKYKNGDLELGKELQSFYESCGLACIKK